MVVGDDASRESMARLSTILTSSRLRPEITDRQNKAVLRDDYPCALALRAECGGAACVGQGAGFDLDDGGEERVRIDRRRFVGCGLVAAWQTSAKQIAPRMNAASIMRRGVRVRWTVWTW